MTNYEKVIISDMKYQSITSPHNPKIKELLNLKRKPSWKGFLIEGPNLVQTALQSGAALKSVFMTEGVLNREKVLLRVLNRKQVEVFEISGDILKKLADTETPQGVLAVAQMEKPSLDSLTFKGKPLIVIADGIKEPGNLGAIIRTADAAGADALVKLPGTVNPLGAKTLRASAGSFFNIPVVEAELSALSHWLKQNQIMLCGTDRRAQRSLFETDLKIPIAFALGEEAHGMGPGLREKADLILRIPVMGKAESLNVAASCAVLLYECVRQREFSP